MRGSGLKFRKDQDGLSMLKERWGHYSQSPANYVEDVILANRVDGVKLLPYQADVLDAVARYDWVALRAGNGIGKDAMSAWLAEWYMMTNENSKVPCTSGVARQLKNILFSEIHNFGRQSKMAPYMRFMDMGVQVKGREKEWFCLGFTASKSTEGQHEAKTEGFHGAKLMWIVTEAKAVEDFVWTAIRKSCTQPHNKIFAQSVPGTEYGEFFKIFDSNRESWRRLHFPSAVRIPDAEGGGWKSNTPTQIINGVETQLVTTKSINEKLSMPGGERGPEFVAGVLGEFIKQTDDALIPMHWIKECIGLQVPSDQNDIVSYGVDPAWFGKDDTAVVKRRGRKVVQIETWNGYEPNATAQRIKDLWEKEPGKVYVDTIGAYALVSLLQNLGIKQVAGVNVATKARREDLYPNLRSELWFNLRDLLDPRSVNRISLPDNEKMVTQLATIHYNFRNSDGKKFVEPKSQLKDSPDIADAIGLAFFDTRASIAVKPNSNTEINYLNEFLLKPKRSEQTLVGIMGLPG